MITLRDYQQETVNAIFNYYLSGNDGNIIAALPTGVGKSLVIGGFIEQTFKYWPDQRFLVMSHVEKILTQDHKATLKLWANAPIGLFSAGLNKKESAMPIVIGGVASIVNAIESLGHRDICIIDECFSQDTEILTENGFVRFDCLQNEKVAQYNCEDKTVDFITPLRKIKNKASKGLLHISSDNNFDMLLTPKHELLINGKKVTAEKAVSATYNKIKVAGLGCGVESELLPWEKFAICYQADGSLHNANKDGSCILAFSFSKERKIEKFLELMKETGYSFNEVVGQNERNLNIKPRRRFMVYLKGVPNKTINDYFKLERLSSLKAKAIVEYLNIWDGHVASKNTYLYTTTNLKMADFYQAIGVLAGYKTKLSKVKDERSEKFSDCYRLHINLNTDEVSTQYWNKKFQKYDDFVYCVEVPTGNIITRRNGKVVITGNCHMVSPEEDSMYQKIITGLSEINPNLKIIGLSATPYRNGQGLLTEGPLFDDIVIDLTSIECFNRFIEEGYLAPLIPKQTNIEINTANIRTVRGDFANNQLDEATEKVIYEALKEAVVQGQDRHSWIVFTSGIKTAEHAAEILQSFGISATAIHSKLKKEECEKRFAAFESGEITAICGNEKFTTGYDFAPVDFCIMLRATKSASKWIQMLGRLTRPYDFNNPQQYIKGFDYVKHNALVLDFAGNCRRLGPINDVQLPHKKGTGSGEVPIKVCESCGAYNHASARFCGGKPYASDEGCGFEFIFKTKLVTQAGTEQLIRGFDNIPVVERFIVDRVIYNRHNKVGSEPSIKVSYWCGLRKFNEYVCLQHKGYAKRKAKLWWQQRSSADVPDTTDEALSFVSTLRCPKAISVRTDLQYPEIISVEW